MNHLSFSFPNSQARLLFLSSWPVHAPSLVALSRCGQTLPDPARSGSGGIVAGLARAMRALCACALGLPAPLRKKRPSVPACTVNHSLSEESRMNTGATLEGNRAADGSLLVRPNAIATEKMTEGSQQPLNLTVSNSVGKRKASEEKSWQALPIKMETLDEEAESRTTNVQDFDIYSAMEWKNGVGFLPGSDLKGDGITKILRQLSSGQVSSSTSDVAFISDFVSTLDRPSYSTPSCGTASAISTWLILVFIDLFYSNSVGFILPAAATFCFSFAFFSLA